MSDLLARLRAVMSPLPVLRDAYRDASAAKETGSSTLTATPTWTFSLESFTNMIGYDITAGSPREGASTPRPSTCLHGQVELAEKMARLSGIPDAKVFLTNSGTEAKRDRAAAGHLSAPAATRKWSVRNSYHGRSYGTIAVTSNRRWRTPSLLPLTVHYLHGTDLPARRSRTWTASTSTCAWARPARRAPTPTRTERGLPDAPEPIRGVGGFVMNPERPARRLQGSPGQRQGHPVHLRRSAPGPVPAPPFWGISRLPPASSPRHDVPRKAWGTGFAISRGGGPRRRPDGRPSGQRGLHVRGNPISTAAGQRHPRLRPRPRPASRRLGPAGCGNSFNR